VRQGGQDAGTVAGILFGTARTPVIHATKQVVGILDNLVTALALDVGNKANAAAVVFLPRIVEALRLR
jgi:hypothetical protein